MNDDLYSLRITYKVQIKKWRVDDQSDIKNREWSLNVYDRNKGSWVATAKLDRPGEQAIIESIEIL